MKKYLFRIFIPIFSAHIITSCHADESKSIAIKPQTDLHFPAKNVTIVTALWLLDGAKYPADKYVEWMKEFFKSVSGNIVVYCNSRSCAEIRKLVKERSNVVLVDKYETPFSMPWMEPLEPIYRLQNSKDPEKNIHIPELYAIWNSKSSLMMEVAAMNPFKSEYFFWVDNGAFRVKDAVRGWPDQGRVNDVFSGDRKDKILLGLISLPKFQQNGFVLEGAPVVGDYIQGGFFAGNAEAIKRFHGRFWYYHDFYLERGVFIGKDQTLMNSFAFIDRGATLIDSHLANPECGDKWFYFLQFFASLRSRGCGIVDLRQL